MSLDLSWEKLDTTLSARLVEILNRHLTTVSRPSFIGPVEVTALDFGTVCPDVELVDMRDIYRDFLEDDDDKDGDGDDLGPRKVTEGPPTGVADEDDFEWVSRRATSRALAQEAPAYHHLPPHLRYGRSPSSDFLSSLAGMHPSRDIWSGGGIHNSLGTGEQVRPSLRPLQGMASSIYSMRSAPATTSVSATPPLSSPPRPKEEENPELGGNAALFHQSQAQQEQQQQKNPHPDLQLHLRILHHSDLRISLTTSLLINYPSPMFMSLPIKLSVTGLVFDGEVVVAYEGSRKRVHFCILDDLDPYGPAADRPKRDSVSTTPPEEGDDDNDADSSARAFGSGGLPPRQTKPLPVGQRLLPSIFIESEIGQADKHVLKNVSRVERFIQDVIRKTIEDELVFPNFHTLILG